MGLVNEIIDLNNQAKGQEGSITDPKVKRKWEELIGQAYPDTDEGRAKRARLDSFFASQRGGESSKDKTKKAYVIFKNRYNALLSVLKVETIVKIIFLMNYPQET